MAGWWCNNHLEKYMSSSMGMVIPFFFWKIKAMFETTKPMGLFIPGWPKKTPTAHRPNGHRFWGSPNPTQWRHGTTDHTMAKCLRGKLRCHGAA
jgi:hypothetical protein